MNKNGRPTTDNKSESIRVRLNQEMRAYMIHKSQTTGKSISELFREYVEKDMLNHK